MSDKDVRVELLAVTGSYLRAFDHGFGVVAIDVEDRRLDGGGERGTIIGAACVIEIGVENRSGC